jgi:hypothetical protein
MEVQEKPKQPPFFRVLKSITLDKRKWTHLDEEEKASFNNWMINKWLSFDIDYCEVVNIIQKNTWQMKGEHLYNLYNHLEINKHQTCFLIFHILFHYMYY